MICLGNNFNMKRFATRVVYSPTDLIQFFESEFACWMERYRLEMPESTGFNADPIDEMQQILFQMGQSREQRYLESLQQSGIDLCMVERTDAWETTLGAMKSGRHYIYQASLQHENFMGYADMLVRVEEPSNLGDWSYIPLECKLALNPKPFFIIQACCYCDLLGSIQGTVPREFCLLLGNAEIKHLRTEDYIYYYRQLRQSFLQFMTRFSSESRPLPKGDSHGCWSSKAERVLRELDHLSQVANMTRSQLRRLEAAGITTMQQLAGVDPTHPISTLDPLIFSRLNQQARLQKQSVGQGIPCYEVLHPSEDDPYKGLVLLPPASPMDIYFDIEGYPLAEGGLEYLFGVTYEADGKLCYQDWWAHNEREEKQAFEQFIDWVYARWQQDPQMHIYHYAAYETIALKRLMSRYTTREDQLDDLLRAGVFVDLYRIVAQGVRVGGKNYSIKTLEKIYWQGRQGDVQNAQDSVVQYFRWMQQREHDPNLAEPLLEEIRSYNQDDCDSTKYLTDWLRGLQTEHGIAYRPKPGQNDSEALQQLTERQVSRAAVSELANQLLAEIPTELGDEAEHWKLQELLAHLLQFHQREAKPFWWQRFAWLEMEEMELHEELDCLAGIQRTSNPPYRPTSKSRSLAYDYQFDPAQDTKLSAATDCWFTPPEPLRGCKLESLDTEQGYLTFLISDKKLNEVRQTFENWEPPQRTSLLPATFIKTDQISQAILETVQNWLPSLILSPVLQDLLGRRSPRIHNHPGGPLITGGTNSLETIVQTAMDLNHSALCIQGPPGSGKTYTAAHIILRLIQEGKTVAVSSTSHRVISNLLGRVATLAIEQGVVFSGAKVGGPTGDAVLEHPQIEFKKTMAEAQPAAFHLVGATVFQCCRSENQGIWDYLFVDEAGQVSLANLVAKARCANNLVLMGDQMQLEQPIQGSHPGESGTSGLGYFLNGKATVPLDLGVFLDVSFRMHPEICRFISELVYEGRLTNHPDTAHHKIAIPTDHNGLIRKSSGILFIPVDHEDNTQSSEEEVNQVEALVTELTGLEYVSDRGQKSGVISNQEILVVAPYNMQVRKLQERLGDRARIGTVDKFQGQEAPVVIVSMCASSGDAVPRGLEFLLNRNRLNVAISRAQCLSVVVGSKALALTSCSTISQMELVNTFCKVVDYA